MKPSATIPAIVLACTLTACGGGGDDAPANGNNSAAAAGGNGDSPGPSEFDGNAVYKVMSAGEYVMWGFGMFVNNVQQIFVSKESVDAFGRQVSAKVAGFTNSPETPPKLTDSATGLSYWTGSEVADCVAQVGYSGTDKAVLTCAGTKLSSVRWNMRLVEEDVAGKKVADYVRNARGTPVQFTWADPSAVFGAGAVAYTADMEAASNMVVLAFSRLILSNPIGSGWCQGSSGSATTQLALRLNADKTVSFFEVGTGSCVYSGNAIGSGSWDDYAVTGGTGYKITYPESVKANPKWSPLFAQGTDPSVAAQTLLIDPDNRGIWRLGNVLPQGTRFRSAQPHFNAAALPALKQAHHLQ